MTSEEKTEICISRTHELLSEAQVLLKDIQPLLDWCTSAGPSHQTHCKRIQQESEPISIEEDNETLVIGGFRFETEDSRKGLRRLRSHADTEGRQNDT